MVQSTTSDAVGISVLGGHHEWSSVVVEKSFTSADRTSLGLKAWYSDLNARPFHLTKRFHGDVARGQHGFHRLDGGQHRPRRRLAFEGFNLRWSGFDHAGARRGCSHGRASSLHLSSWTAQLHNTPLMLSTESIATVRSFSPQNTAQSARTALGDGTLYYGSTSNPTISTSASYRFVETDVTFTDLQAHPSRPTLLFTGLS